jgi:hypothetical protein
MQMISWLTWSGIKDILLFLLALYGAALSTFNLLQSIHKDRRQIMIGLRTIIPAFADGQTGKCFAILNATNAGHRPVTVTTLALELPTGQNLFPSPINAFPGHPNTLLPATLSDGQSAHASVSYSDMATALLQHGMHEKIKIIPICYDSTDQIYKGEPWEVNPREFLRM